MSSANGHTSYSLLMTIAPSKVHLSSLLRIKSMGLPPGLLPKDVKSYNFSGSGLIQVFLGGPCLTKFDTMAFYESELRANLTYGSLTGVVGLSQEELFLWLPVKDIIVDDLSSGLILIDIGVAHKQLSLSLFEDPPDCSSKIPSTPTRLPHLYSQLEKVMDESLEELCSRLSLAEDEKININVSPHLGDDMNNSICLIGKLLAPRTIGFEQISGLFRKLWSPKGKLNCKPLADNTVLFSFSEAADKQRVQLGSPWLFDKYIILLVEAAVDMITSNIEFKKSPFWIQIHDLPLGLMTSTFAEIAGNTVEKFIAVDCDQSGSVVGRFLRIRAEIDISKPLRRVFQIDFMNHKVTVLLKYERLPDFCFFCGRIGHLVRDCNLHVLNSPHQKSHFEYGNWLRAPTTSSPFTTNRYPTHNTSNHTSTPTSSAIPHPHTEQPSNKYPTPTKHHPPLSPSRPGPSLSYLPAPPPASPPHRGPSPTHTSAPLSINPPVVHPLAEQSSPPPKNLFSIPLLSNLPHATKHPSSPPTSPHCCNAPLLLSSPSISPYLYAPNSCIPYTPTHTTPYLFTSKH
ncbi:hypothetical protein DH2020_033629 [Rehmannia glutinosa]|uniref:CCHC-type domain-containing protein n=1 Tax=Rehmannia glutinosa TaxID=99300 RepID=A0ABR0VCM4_REHGL